MSNALAGDIEQVHGAIERAGAGLVERDALVEVLFLAAVAGEHVLVIGPPGTAKSQVVRSVSRQFSGHYFEYLIGRFTEPNEIFGPVDLRKLRDGIVEIETAGMLPEADFVFLDEVFLGSTAILNTLLGILNEKTFRRGSTAMDVPLRLCVGASNAMPAETSLAAFADRFLVRMFIDPIEDGMLDDLLFTAWNHDHAATGQSHSRMDIDVLDRLRVTCRDCDLRPVRPALADAIRAMRSAGIPITDRRAVKAQSLIAAAAVLDGRTVANPTDLWTLPLIVPTNEAQITAREILGPVLDHAANALLPNAAELLSASRAARAGRLVETGRGLLPGPERPDDDDIRLRREAVVREIDATFSPDQLTPELSTIRQRLVESLDP